MEERRKKVFVALFMYWCLYMKIQDILSIQALIIGHELEIYNPL